MFGQEKKSCDNYKKKEMSPLLILAIVLSYFGVLLVISFFTSKNVNNEGFFLGNKKSKWYIVAIGMLGSSISGVTFISVPGWVQTTQMTYMQMVLGFLLGYIVIAHVLLPLYYRLNLTSIYTYLENRFGIASYKTGASFFLLSRTIGSAARLYVVAHVLQVSIFQQLHIPFWATVIVTIILIWLYTYKGGIKTIIWTDTLQTLFLFSALIATIIIVTKELNYTFAESVSAISKSPMSKIFEFSDWGSSQHFVKQFISGALITIVMTGLDQDMMQKNLSCKSLKDAQRNMFTFSGILVFVNALFLILGGLLCVYAVHKGIDISSMKTDRIFPTIAIQYLPAFAAIVFILGLISAGYSSADGTLTALTTVICYDFLGLEKKDITIKQKTKIRHGVHIGVSILFLIIILIFSRFHNDALIRIIFNVASYTYGPLLGLYVFGMFTNRNVINDKIVPIIAFGSPIICFFLNKYSEVLFFGYHFGFELLLVNGLMTFIGLWLISIKSNHTNKLNKPNTI